MQDLLAGDVPLMFVDYATARSHIAAGTLKALGVAARRANARSCRACRRSPRQPGLPASKPGRGRASSRPPRRRPTIIAKLHDTYIAAVADPVVRQKLIDAGTEILQSTPQEFADYRAKEAAKWAEVIKAANLELD